jgi:hypothetical protein
MQAFTWIDPSGELPEEIDLSGLADGLGIHDAGGFSKVIPWADILAMHGEANPDLEEMEIFTVTMANGDAIVFECEDQNQLVVTLEPFREQAAAAAAEAAEPSVLMKEREEAIEELETQLAEQEMEVQHAEETQAQLVEAQMAKEEETEWKLPSLVEAKQTKEEEAKLEAQAIAEAVEEAARKAEDTQKVNAEEEARKAKTKSKRQAMLDKKRKQKEAMSPRVSQADMLLMNKIMDIDTGHPLLDNAPHREQGSFRGGFVDPIAAAHEQATLDNGAAATSGRKAIRRQSSRSARALADKIFLKQDKINEKNKAKKEEQQAIRAIEEAEKAEKMAKELIEAERIAYEAMTPEERDEASVKLLVQMEADAAAESKRLVEQLTKGEDESLRLARQLADGLPSEPAAGGNNGEEEHGPMDAEDRARQSELAAMSDPTRFPTRIWTVASPSSDCAKTKTKSTAKLEGMTPNFKKIMKVLVHVHEMLAAAWDEDHPDYEKYDFEEDEEMIGDFCFRNKEPTSHLRPSRKKLRKMLKEQTQGHQHKSGSLLHKVRGGLKNKKKRKDGKGDEDDQLDESQKKCSICESLFHNGDEVRTLPCLHTFHSKSCIDKWLRSSDRCPVCQQQVQFLGLRLDVENSWDFAEELADNGQLV